MTLIKLSYAVHRICASRSNCPGLDMPGNEAALL